MNRYGYGLFSLNVKGKHFHFAITEFAGFSGAAV